MEFVCSPPVCVWRCDWLVNCRGRSLLSSNDSWDWLLSFNPGNWINCCWRYSFHPVDKWFDELHTKTDFRIIVRTGNNRVQVQIPPQLAVESWANTSSLAPWEWFTGLTTEVKCQSLCTMAVNKVMIHPCQKHLTESDRILIYSTPCFSNLTVKLQMLPKKRNRSQRKEKTTLKHEAVTRSKEMLQRDSFPFMIEGVKSQSTNVLNKEVMHFSL